MSKTVKEQLALVKQATDDNYKIKDWYTEESGGKSWYKLELTNELTYSILYKKDCVEDIAEVSSFINKHRTSTIVNLPNGDFVKPKTDAPFYQGMTKEETLKSIRGYVAIKANYRNALFKKTDNLFLFGHIVVYQEIDGSTIELVRRKDTKEWHPLGCDNPYYKELIQLESPAKKKEQERIEERFEEMEAKYLEGIKDVGYHLDWLKDMKQKNPNWYKDHVRREYMELNFGHHICQISAEKMRKEAKELLDKVDEDIVNSLDKSGEDMDSLNDGVLAKDFDFAEYSKKMILAQHGLSGIITAQDLIQAAKDELVDRVYGRCCSSVDAKQGFAECIKFMEETMGKDPYKN